jgi:pimeloyl-ACP methyl ester carboxylesterase
MTAGPLPLPGPTSDPRPERVLLPGGAVSYVDEGPRDAPAVVALHGVPGSLRDFRYLAPQLTEHVRFVRVDLPGFGGSDPVDAAVATLPGRARAVLALTEHLGLSTFGVLGHSMGGATALVLAAGHRKRVGLLTLVASMGLRRHRGLGMSPRAFALFSRGLRAPLLSAILVRVARRQYRRRRFPGADDMGPADFALQFRAIGATDFGLLRRAAAGALPPTLVVYAADDRLVEPRIAEELLGMIPHARALRFETGGHNLQKTRALELGKAIHQQLSR